MHFSNKVGKLRLTFTLANSGSEEVSEFVLQSKMGRTVSVSQTLVYAQCEIALVWLSYVEKIPDDRGMLLFLHHPRLCRLMKTPNHPVDIAVSTGRLGKNHKNRECAIFPTHPTLLRWSAIISDMRKLKNLLLWMSGIDRRSSIFAWSRPWPDFPDTHLSTISDDRWNREIPDLRDIWEPGFNMEFIMVLTNAFR